MPQVMVVVVASVVDAVETPAVVKKMAVVTVPRLLVPILSTTEAVTDALTIRDARNTAKAPKDRLQIAVRSRNAIIARSTTRTHGSTNITTLRDLNTTTRLR